MKILANDIWKKRVFLSECKRTICNFTNVIKKKEAE